METKKYTYYKVLDTYTNKYLLAGGKEGGPKSKGKPWTSLKNLRCALRRHSTFDYNMEKFPDRYIVEEYNVEMSIDFKGSKPIEDYKK